MTVKRLKEFLSLFPDAAIVEIHPHANKPDVMNYVEAHRDPQIVGRVVVYVGHLDNAGVSINSQIE